MLHLFPKEAVDLQCRQQVSGVAEQQCVLALHILLESRTAGAMCREAVRGSQELEVSPEHGSEGNQMPVSPDTALTQGANSAQWGTRPR